MTLSIDPQRPPAHIRPDRTLREVCYPTTSLSHSIAQINHIIVTDQGQQCPPHMHRNLWETFVCLEGTVILTTRDLGATDIARYVLTPGEQLTVKAYTAHALVASPHSRYLELRSTLYSLERDDPDKVFLSPEDEYHMIELNSLAVLEEQIHHVSPRSHP